MATIIIATNKSGRRKLIHAQALDQIVNYLVYRSARILRYKFQKDMQAVGLDMTQEQYFILFKLWRKDGQYQAELADDFLGDSPNITRILDGMERKKMVERRGDPGIDANSAFSSPTRAPNPPALSEACSQGTPGGLQRPSTIRTCGS